MIPLKYAVQAGLRLVERFNDAPPARAIAVCPDNEEDRLLTIYTLLPPRRYYLRIFSPSYET